MLTDEIKVDQYEPLTFEDANVAQQNAQWENKSGGSIDVASVRSLTVVLAVFPFQALCISQGTRRDIRIVITIDERDIS